jgi:hypothetical protein
MTGLAKTSIEGQSAGAISRDSERQYLGGSATVIKLTPIAERLSKKKRPDVCIGEEGCLSQSEKDLT